MPSRSPIHGRASSRPSGVSASATCGTAAGAESEAPALDCVAFWFDGAAPPQAATIIVSSTIDFSLTIHSETRSSRPCHGADALPLRGNGLFGDLTGSRRVEVKRLRWQRHHCPVSLDDPHDVEQQLLLCFQELIPIGGEHIGEDFDIERKRPELEEPDADGVGTIHQGMGGQVAACFVDDGSQLRRSGLVAEPDEMMKPELV